MVPFPVRVVSADDQILLDVQNGRDRWPEFQAAFGAYLANLSHRFRADRRLGEADREDALQEAYVYLIDPDRPRYEPLMASARTYLYFALQSGFQSAVPRAGRRGEVDIDAVAPEGTPTAGEEGFSVPPAQTRYDDRQFAQYVFRVLDSAELGLLREVANDRSLKDLSVAYGVSRPTMSRTVRRLRVRLTERAAVALGA
jgi:hypothetical protein